MNRSHFKEEFVCKWNPPQGIKINERSIENSLKFDHWFLGLRQFCFLLLDCPLLSPLEILEGELCPPAITHYSSYLLFCFRRAVWVFGLLLSILGGVCTLIFLIYLPIFMRVMATRSETAVYRPRTADALTDVSKNSK